MRSLFALLFMALPLQAAEPMPVPYWESAVANGTLPPISERLPQPPKRVDLAARKREVGQYGGTLRSFISRRKDIRQMVVYGYARLVGYNDNYELVPDLLEALEVVENRKFTFHLRRNHRWSDGHPFTSEDFRYWWEDVANNPDLSPSGPHAFLKVDGALPRVAFPDAQTVIFEWDAPNPAFLQTLAQARDPFIYRPAHYLRQFHSKYADAETLAGLAAKRKVAGWAPLHNKFDNMYKFDNPALPTLQPWVATKGANKSRFIFERNPYYHRIDTEGHQLPYIDQVEMLVVAAGLIPVKANAGESDLQARGLAFRDIAVLKRGETDGGYHTNLWVNGTASQIAIYPNLNYADPAFRKLFRDPRFRRALSLGADRRMINRALYFGLADEGNMTVLPKSPFFSEANRQKWAQFDTKRANRLLDEIGMTDRDAYGIRLLPDGRPLRLIVETAGERQEVENALQILVDTWRELGIQLIQRPLDRDILRNRVYSGQSMAAVWYGWDNGMPQSYTPPDHIAPMKQEFFAWPKWGQYAQSGGTLGEAPDLPAAKKLMRLAKDWSKTDDPSLRQSIWQEMIDIHADEVFAIGLISGAPQPVVVNNDLRNVPAKAIWAWEPGAHFGIHRMDEFFFDKDAAQ